MARSTGGKPRRITRRALEPFHLTRLESYAKRLRREGKTLPEITRAVAALADTWEVPRPYMSLSHIGARTFAPTWSVAPFTARERDQIAAMRAGLEGDPDVYNAARRTLFRWLSKGQLRRQAPFSPPAAYVPVWVDQVRCIDCGRREGVLRKILTRRDVRVQVNYPSWLLHFGAEARRIYGALMIGALLTATWLFPPRERGRGYCRGCKRYRLFRVVNSARVPDAEVAALLAAVADQPSLRRSRFLLVWLGRDRTPK